MIGLILKLYLSMSTRNTINMFIFLQNSNARWIFVPLAVEKDNLWVEEDVVRSKEVFP